jgi:hypothetical protein
MNSLQQLKIINENNAQQLPLMLDILFPYHALGVDAETKEAYIIDSTPPRQIHLSTRIVILVDTNTNGSRVFVLQGEDSFIIDTPLILGTACILSAIYRINNNISECSIISE